MTYKNESCIFLQQRQFNGNIIIKDFVFYLSYINVLYKSLYYFVFINAILLLLKKDDKKYRKIKIIISWYFFIFGVTQDFMISPKFKI
jgi:hypothetical protein